MEWVQDGTCRADCGPKPRILLVPGYCGVPNKRGKESSEKWAQAVVPTWRWPFLASSSAKLRELFQFCYRHAELSKMCFPGAQQKGWNNANEQCVLFLNSPQAVDSPPENKSLEKHPKRDQPGQADLLRWHRSRAKVSEEGRAGSAALQAPRAAMLPLLPAAHPGAWRARQTVLLLLGSSAGCGGDKREALTSGLSPPTCG